MSEKSKYLPLKKLILIDMTEEEKKAKKILNELNMSADRLIETLSNKKFIKKMEEETRSKRE